MTDWPKIVSRYNGLVWRTAYRLLGRPDEAAECLQETFSEALEVSRSQKVRNWPNLLIRLCTARAIRRLKKRLYHTHHVNGLAKWSTVPLSDSTPVESPQTVELSARPRLALTQLPRQQAEVFCLHFLSDFSHREIAKQLGIRTSLVTALLDRSCSRLRELLARTNGSGYAGGDRGVCTPEQFITGV